MANPNIVNVVNIFGNTATLAVSTTTANIVQNPTSSSTLYKINSLMVTNVNTFTSAVSVTVQLNQANVGTISTIAQNMVVPANSSLVILGKDTPVYLLENNSIQLTAGSNNSLNAFISYEQIS
jgi:hypothetical protein